MTSFAYISFLICAAALGAALGFIGHYWRAHVTFPPEDLGLGEPWDTLTRDDYQFEKNVIGAKWDDSGYWDAESNRNLAYYVISGAMLPLVLGLIFWGNRAEIVSATCQLLAGMGLRSPLC